MTYEELIKLIANKDNFDAVYTINNLSVKEVFYNKYITNSNEWFDWNDTADKHSVKEAMSIVSG